MKFKHLTLLLCASAMLFTPGWAAGQLSSCDAIRAYWKNALPGDPYAVIQDMRSAMDYLASDPSGCPIYDVERVRWTYATSLDAFSRTFPGDAVATGKWADQAVKQYRNYLEWFLSLGSDEIDALIVGVTGRDTTSAGFAGLRARWLRQRVGNVLTSLGDEYTFTKSYSSLVDAYGDIAGQCLEQRGEPVCVGVFPLEVVRLWHKWLRALPDFAQQRTDAQIKNLLKSDEDCAQKWAAFKSFLDTYVPANPSTKTEWDPLRKKVSTWLDM